MKAIQIDELEDLGPSGFTYLDGFHDRARINQGTGIRDQGTGRARDKGKEGKRDKGKSPLGNPERALLSVPWL
jgi:hypothetical protein